MTQENEEDRERRRKQLRIVARHSEARLFCGNGASELLVYLPPFATDQDRAAFSSVLFTLGDAIKQPFSQEASRDASPKSPMRLKVHADDEHTLHRLATAKNTLNQPGLEDLLHIVGDHELS